MVEPGKASRITEIGTSLGELQKVVGGLIECYYPFPEEVCIVCNDDGKFNGMEPCRAIRDEDGKMMDIIFGSFFVCSCETENFGSLSEEQLERYQKLFHSPEIFIHNGENKICAIPYDPCKEKD